MAKSGPNYQFSLALLFYNEEKNVRAVVTSLQNSLDRAGLDYQLLLVDNGSVDRTPELIRGLLVKSPRLKMVEISTNLGYGWGVINGLKGAEGEWIGFMDGDAQISPEDVVRFMQAADADKYDLVKVRRLKRLDGFIRARVSEVYGMLFGLLFGIHIYDVNAKPVIFRREWLESFRLLSRDWFIDAEILLKALHLQLRIKEVPVIFRKREAGRSSVRISTIWEFLRNMVKYRLGKEFKQWKLNVESRS